MKSRKVQVNQTSVLFTTRTAWPVDCKKTTPENSDWILSSSGTGAGYNRRKAGASTSEPNLDLHVTPGREPVARKSSRILSCAKLNWLWHGEATEVATDLAFPSDDAVLGRGEIGVLMNEAGYRRLERHRTDHQEVTGEPFKHFFCPILFVDDDVQLMRGYAINKQLTVRGRWAVQRSDIDNFYGRMFE